MLPAKTLQAPPGQDKSFILGPQKELNENQLMLNYRANSFPPEVWKVNVHYLLNQNFPISNIWIGEKIWKLLKTLKWNNLFSLLGGNKVTAIFRSNVTLPMVPATGHRLQILTISGAPVNICSGPLLPTWNIHPAILFPITVPLYNSIFTLDTCKIAFGSSWSQ